MRRCAGGSALVRALQKAGDDMGAHSHSASRGGNQRRDRQDRRNGRGWDSVQIRRAELPNCKALPGRRLGAPGGLRSRPEDERD
jgi:hypothetical protein